jgi:hypothetical protein
MTGGTTFPAIASAHSAIPFGLTSPHGLANIIKASTVSSR